MSATVDAPPVAKPLAETEQSPVNVIHPLNSWAIRALDAQKRRPGDVLKDGEALHFSVNLIDGAPDRAADAKRASIDETIKAAIGQRAKLANLKPAEWLAIALPREIESLIETAAKDHVAALGGEGIARGFALDSIIRRMVDAEHGQHDGKFQFMGDAAPAFDRERAEFLARSRFGLQCSDAGPSGGGSLAAARYMAGAKLVDAEAQPNPIAPTHDSGQARPAAINALRSARYGSE